nr:ATP-dependent RNA helicase DEAH11, chloroplastic-like [Ipomoea batatas]
MKDSLQESTSSDPLPKMSSFAPGSYYQQQRRPYPDANSSSRNCQKHPQSSSLCDSDGFAGTLCYEQWSVTLEVMENLWRTRLAGELLFTPFLIRNVGLPSDKLELENGLKALMHINFQNTSLGCGTFHMIGRSSGVVASYVSNVVRIVLDISIGRRSMFRSFRLSTPSLPTKSLSFSTDQLQQAPKAFGFRTPTDQESYGVFRDKLELENGSMAVFSRKSRSDKIYQQILISFSTRSVAQQDTRVADQKIPRLSRFSDTTNAPSPQVHRPTAHNRVPRHSHRCRIREELVAGRFNEFLISWANSNVAQP